MHYAFGSHLTVLSTIQEGIRRATSHNSNLAIAFAAFIGMFFTASAIALSVPATTDLAFSIYDVVVNKILGGPIGFVGGVLIVVFGAVNITKSWMLAIGCVISGSAIIQAKTLVTSLGMSIGLM